MMPNPCGRLTVCGKVCAGTPSLHTSLVTRLLFYLSTSLSPLATVRSGYTLGTEVPVWKPLLQRSSLRSPDWSR